MPVQMITESDKQVWDNAFADKKTIAPLEEGAIRDVTTRLLENQLAEGNKYIKTKAKLQEYAEKLAQTPEQGGPVDIMEETTVSDVAKWDPILISMARRSAASLVAHDLMGVQPMKSSNGLIFSMKSFYGSDPSTGTEALGLDKPDINFSGADYLPTTDALGNEYHEIQSRGTDQSGGYGNSGVNGLTSTAQLEQMGVRERATQNASDAVADAAMILKAANIWPEMSFRIEKVSVEAESRMLKAKYTQELETDLKAIHGLNARDELANILHNELTAEQNRETISVLMDQAVVGCTNTAQAGFFNLDVDADGRWSVEKFKGLLLQINREAHQIAIETRRGVGNVIITTPNIVAALDMAGHIDKSITTGSMNVDGVGVTYAGVLNGRFKVFIDPYATAGVEYVIVGYKSNSTSYDAGVYFCPYVPYQIMEAKDTESFQPVIGFKTRYGMAVNPFIGDFSGRMGAGTRGKNTYFRKFVVTNL